MSSEDAPGKTPKSKDHPLALDKKELTRDLIAFFGTVIAVSVFDWQTKDVIWGLWICSLTFGYTTIVVTIFAPIFGSKRGSRMGRLPGGLFLLAFFTIHFGGFHFGHAYALNSLFPLADEGDGFISPITLLGASIWNYWPIVLATFLSRFSDLSYEIRTSALKQDDKALLKPYLNVMRMHLLIFLFAGLNAVDLGDIAIYPVLLFYFFPWRAFYAKRKKA